MKNRLGASKQPASPTTRFLRFLRSERFRSLRPPWSRRAVGIGVVATVAVGSLVAVGAYFFVCAMVRGQVEAKIRRKLDMRVEVGDASARLWGVSFDDVVLDGRDGGVHIALERVYVHGSLFAMALRGPRAATKIEASGAQIVVNLAHPGAARSVARARAALANNVEPEASDRRASREIVLERVEASLRDAQGQLVHMQNGSIRQSAAGRTTLKAREVSLGAAPFDVMRLQDASIELALERGKRVVSRASVGSGEVVWAERESLLDRLSQAQKTLSNRRKQAGNAPGGQLASGAHESLRDHLAQDVEVEMQDVDVRRKTDAGTRDVLRDFSGSVRGLGNDSYQARGAGTTDAGGSLRWDMRVSPESLRAEGTVAFERLPLAFVAPFLPDLPWYEPERAVMRGSLLVRGDGPTRVFMRGNVAFENVALNAARIAPEPIRDITLSLSGEAWWFPAARRLEIHEGEVSAGEAHAQLRGAVEWASDHYAADLVGVLAPTDCNAAVSAVPRDLLADTAGFSWEGRMGGRLHLRVDSRELDKTRLELEIAENCAFLTVPAVADLRRIREPFTHRVQEPDGTLFEMTTGPGTSNWTSIEAISPFLLHAVLAHEDASFFAHHGFAPWAIEEALARNLAARRYVQGASTITMQLAKNLFLQREKTLARKVQEVILTWWLEHSLEKRDILELYLNIIEYAPGVYGIRNASQHYFGREPSELSPAESVFLACVLPAPKLYHGQFMRGTVSAGMAARMRGLLEHMMNRGRIDADALAYGIAELPTFRLGAEQTEPTMPRMLPKGAAPLPFESSVPTENEWESIDSNEGFDDPEM